MIKVVSKSGNLANLLRTTSSIGATTIIPAVPAVPEEEKQIFPSQQCRMTAYTASSAVATKKMLVVQGPAASYSVRYSHTDIKVPDFTPYRRESCKNPNVNNREAYDSQKFYTTVAVGVGLSASAYLAKGLVTTFVGVWSASANVMALSKIEISKGDVPEGKNITFKWRGKPLFVRHRTDEEIKTETSVDVGQLKDPQHDSERVKDPKWLIVVGVCTHLGCIPIANQGDWGGYYCPCHGSHYDASGRIRKGPAPLNLEVPPYEFVGDTIVVG